MMVGNVYQPKAIAVTNIDELNDIKQDFFKLVQHLAETKSLSDSDVNQLYKINDKLGVWRPDLEERK